MDQNTELLNFVHKNVKMGIDTIAPTRSPTCWISSTTTALRWR